MRTTDCRTRSSRRYGPRAWTSVSCGRTVAMPIVVKIRPKTKLVRDDYRMLFVRNFDTFPRRVPFDLDFYDQDVGCCRYSDCDEVFLMEIL